MTDQQPNAGPAQDAGFGAIQQRYLNHEVSYERPGRGSPCWMEYRTAGQCNCLAEVDMEWLIDNTTRLRADLEHARAELAALRADVGPCHACDNGIPHEHPHRRVYTRLEGANP